MKQHEMQMHCDACVEEHVQLIAEEALENQKGAQLTRPEGGHQDLGMAGKVQQALCGMEPNRRLVGMLGVEKN